MYHKSVNIKSIRVGSNKWMKKDKIDWNDQMQCKYGR